MFVNVKVENGQIVNIPYEAYLKDYASRGCTIVQETKTNDSTNDNTTSKNNKTAQQVKAVKKVSKSAN